MLVSMVWFVYAAKSQRAATQSHAAATLSRDKVAQQNRRCDVGLICEQVERLRAYGLLDVLPAAAFTVDTRIDSAYLTVTVTSIADDSYLF